MATKKKVKVTEDIIVKGTHLTVTIKPDGKTFLEWDDEQLLKEVREAIASVENKPAKKTVAKKTTKGKTK